MRAKILKKYCSRQVWSNLVLVLNCRLIMLQFKQVMLNRVEEGPS